MKKKAPQGAGANPHLRVDSHKPARKSPKAARKTPSAPRRGTSASRGTSTALPRSFGGGRRRILGGAVLAAALGAAWLAGPLGGGNRPSCVWRGYETLLIRSDVAASGGLQKVVNALGPNVVSELTAKVSFWNFTGIDSVAVADVDARIDPSDPRRDRAMDALSGYFHSPSNQGNRWSIAYVPSARGAVKDYLSIAAIIGFPLLGEWRMAEFDPFVLIVSVTGLMSLAVLLAHPMRKEGRARLPAAGAGALVWVPFLFPGGVARIALAFFLFAAWFQVAEVFIELRGSDDKLLRTARGPLVRFLAAAGMGLVLFFLFNAFSPAAFAGYAGPVTASVLVLVAIALFSGREERSRERRKKFEPVRIVKGSAAFARPAQAGFLVVMIVILAVAGMTVARSAAVPTPLPLPGVRGFSWDALSRLSRQSRAARLPDMSDLVTHEAFQETIAFGRPWRLPVRDERVYIREFSVNVPAGLIVEGFRRVKVFDSAWLDSVTRRFAPGKHRRHADLAAWAGHRGVPPAAEPFPAGASSRRPRAVRFLRMVRPGWARCTLDEERACALKWRSAAKPGPMTHPTKLPRGGIDPPTEILVPRGAVIANAVIPSRALIPLLQHAGKPAAVPGAGPVTE